MRLLQPCPVCTGGKALIIAVDWVTRRVTCEGYQKAGAGGVPVWTGIMHNHDLDDFSTEAPTPVATDTRYPHKCPKCGGDAYVGLNQVEHRGEPRGAKGECP